MADSIIAAIAEAIHKTLWDTGRFVSGYAYATPRTGTRPTFNVWWDGFSWTGPQSRADRQPEVTTFRYIIEVRENLAGDAEGSQQRLMSLVQACYLALAANNHLGIRRVLRSRLVSGSMDVDTESDQPMLVASLVLEADYAGTWAAPQ